MIGLLISAKVIIHGDKCTNLGLKELVYHYSFKANFRELCDDVILLDIFSLI